MSSHHSMKCILSSVKSELPNLVNTAEHHMLEAGKVALADQAGQPEISLSSCSYSKRRREVVTEDLNQQ